MKQLLVILILTFSISTYAQEQKPGVELTSKTYKTSEGLEIAGHEGFLTVAENRYNPNSRLIRVKFIRLKSLSAAPTEPVIFLEGGGATVTWQAERPKDLQYWLPILQVADLIFIDQRGNGVDEMNYIEMGELPTDFFNTEEDARSHYLKMIDKALPYFKQKNIDYQGYTLESHARDVHEIAKGLGIDQYKLMGFSFGSSIGMATMTLYPEQVKSAVFVGADAPHQSLNYPAHLDKHMETISDMVKADEQLSQQIPDFERLLESTLDQLEKKPLTVKVINPITGKEMPLTVGRFGFSLLLRLDIDDANDIPVIPRLVYEVSNGETSLLRWFLQKRLPYALAIPANGLNQGIASGVSNERWKKIRYQAKVSPYGNAVNFPFHLAQEIWPETTMKLKTNRPIRSKIPTLFVTGDLDCRTSVQQTLSIMEGFKNAQHVIVVNAGHEQTLWNARVFDEYIPAFLRGEEIGNRYVRNKTIEFISLTGPSDAHPALKN